MDAQPKQIETGALGFEQAGISHVGLIEIDKYACGLPCPPFSKAGKQLRHLDEFPAVGWKLFDGSIRKLERLLGRPERMGAGPSCQSDDCLEHQFLAGGHLQDQPPGFELFAQSRLGRQRYGPDAEAACIAQVDFAPFVGHDVAVVGNGRQVVGTDSSLHRSGRS